MATQNQSLLDPYKNNMSTPAVPNMSYMQPYTPAPANYSPYSPATPAVSAAPSTSGTVNYTVRSGDTLSAIARSNNLSLNELLDLNPQYRANPNLIRPGESIALNSMRQSSRQNQSLDPNYGVTYNESQSLLPYTPDPMAGYNYTPELPPYTPDPNYGRNQSIAPNQSYATSADLRTQTPQTLKTSYTPPTPAIPQINETPTTSDGNQINLDTGGVTPAPIPAAVTAPAPSTASSGGATIPNIGTSLTSPGYDAAVKAYEESLGLTPEEISNQEEINKIKDMFRRGYQGESERPIAMEFITGRQKALEGRALNQLQPLLDEAALLQARRTGASDAAKFKLEQEGLKIGLEQDAKKPIAGSTFFDPQTKQFYTAPATGIGEQFTLGEGQIRYNELGQIVATNPKGGTGTQSGVISPDAVYWASLIKAGQASLSDVPSDFRTEVARAQATMGGLSKASQDAITQAGVVMDFVDRAYPQITGTNTGILGKAQATIPGTGAYDLNQLIDTIKANVGFSALQAMRAASPTGGALGQVSEMENRLLQATLGSLDIGQSSAQLRKNLEKVKLHFTNLINILNQAAQPMGGNNTETTEGGFNW